MIRRHVLAALATGVEVGDDAAAREAVTHIDPVLRGPARRRLERALIDAMLLTGVGYTGEDVEGMRHVQRVAALDIAGKHGVDVRDRRAVAEIYARLPTQAPSSAPFATVIAVSSFVLLLVTLVYLAIRVPPHTRAERRPIPIGTGAFATGGTPTEDAALAMFLANDLMQLVIETDADRQGSHEGAVRAKHSAELREAPVIVGRNAPALTAAWHAFVDALDRWVNTSTRDSAFKIASSDLGTRAQELSEQFGALGLGYYVSADIMQQGTTAHAAVFSYRVEHVAFVRAGGDARRVLSLRRLDRINLTLAMLGRQGDELGDPVVLLDQTDDFAINKVLPVLDSEPYRLGDADWRRSSSAGRVLASRAADAIDAELRIALGPARLDPDARTRVVKDLVAASVRRHEARHGIDYDRERPLRYPAPLAKLLGARSGGTTRAELELAAYLSQIANEPVLPQWPLWNLASLAFGQRWGSAEGYAAVVVLEGLARQLGSAPSHPLVANGHLDREGLANLALPLASQSDDKLRAAARALWIELYGEPVLPLVDVPGPS